MASDGDLYQKRLIFGFHKAYKVAVDGGSMEEEAAMILDAAQKALRGEYRVGAFGPMVATAQRVIAAYEQELLSAAGPSTYEAMLGVQLDVIERRYGDQVATGETRRLIEALARESLAEGVGQEVHSFRAQCESRLVRWLVDRLHFKPTELCVRKALNLDRAAAWARQDAVFQRCEPQLRQWLNEAQANPKGRLPVAKLPATVDINSTAGLQESLI